jgi:ribosomal protein L16/L10AE
VRPEIAQEALRLAAQKMPIRCKIIGKEDVVEPAAVEATE